MGLGGDVCGRSLTRPNRRSSNMDEPSQLYYLRFGSEWKSSWIWPISSVILNRGEDKFPSYLGVPGIVYAERIDAHGHLGLLSLNLNDLYHLSNLVLY